MREGRFTLLPWPQRRMGTDPFDGIGEGAQVFVPAIMSVGLVFSAITLARDAVMRTGIRSRERRTAIEANSVLNEVLGAGAPEPSELGLLSRRAYLFSALLAVASAAVLVAWSTANFVRDGGLVADVSWVLALCLSLVTILGFAAAVCASVFRSWPDPPSWVHGSLRTAPLSVTPGSDYQGPSWTLSLSIVVAAISTLAITLLVGTSEATSLRLDRPLQGWMADASWLEQLRFVDPFGATAGSLLLVVIVGVSGFRCRVMAALYPALFVLGWLTVEVIGDLVARPRPTGLGEPESYPSGHLVQAIFLAGLVPLAMRVFFDSQRLSNAIQVLLGVGVVATAIHRIHIGNHWPLDALGALGLGMMVVLSTYWGMAHISWHQHCRSCPWSDASHAADYKRGVLPLSEPWRRRLALLAPALALGAAAVLAALTLTIGLPSNQEGSSPGNEVAARVQLGLAAIVGLAGLLAIRWKAYAAFSIAIAAMALGLLAAVEYRPTLAFGLTVALMIPAVVTWLGWQHTATRNGVTLLATVTLTGLIGTAVGTSEIYDFYLGPTHPASMASPLDSDADWLWLGAVRTDEAVVTAGGLSKDEVARLSYWPTHDRAAGVVVEAIVSANGVVTFALSGLAPGEQYQYRVENSGVATSSDAPADGSFTTFRHGAQDLTIVIGACARRGSNGAVFDAVVAETPDLYLAVGDLHYGNLESSNADDHVAEWGRAVGQPGQSALFRSTPTAYVWDDHDFGPNDASSSSPSASAASSAYREVVPNYGVDPDRSASIAQAFTVGRVRVVLSDTRSQRTDSTMLGEEQLEWLINELVESSRTHALVIWANPTPWISAAGSGSDDWSHYAVERSTIANALAAANVENLVMVSGDAHMVAIDDGTHSGYADDGTPGFPVLHAAALDRPGSSKGGPYSHGSFSGGGQYGKLQISDDGAAVKLRMSGHTWDGRELVVLELTYSTSVAVD